ncbi:MAG: hypothetical protein F6J93_10310 [Oscillatoria sp. SIO1A7]|nr:hypothetical protein [Oscillatoria sp. SIO1A7]
MLLSLEKPGAGKRIVDFVEESAIPHAMFSILREYRWGDRGVEAPTVYM